MITPHPGDGAAPRPPDRGGSEHRIEIAGSCGHAPDPRRPQGALTVIASVRAHQPQPDRQPGHGDRRTGDVSPAWWPRGWRNCSMRTPPAAGSVPARAAGDPAAAHEGRVSMIAGDPAPHRAGARQLTATPGEAGGNDKTCRRPSRAAGRHRAPGRRRWPVGCGLRRDSSGRSGARPPLGAGLARGPASTPTRSRARRSPCCTSTAADGCGCFTPISTGSGLEAPRISASKRPASGTACSPSSGPIGSRMPSRTRSR